VQKTELAKWRLVLLPIACCLFWASFSVMASAQDFTVIATYEAVPEFIEAFRELPRDRQIPFYRRQLYFEHVLEPYKDACGMEFLEEDMSFPYPRGDLDELTEAIEVMRESDVEQRVTEALEQSSVLLPGPDVAVCLFVNDYPFIREHRGGVTGDVLRGRSIELMLFPEEGWLDWAPYWAAALYYVVVWLSHYEVPEEQRTLLDAIVHVGRVHSFASLIYPEMAPPETRALTPEQEAEGWQRMQDQLDSTDPTIIRAYLFGDMQTPRWTAYTVGFNIMQSFLERHTEVGIEEWTAMSAQEILERSGYDPGR
jgi:uncharacterized protein YjaZ